MRKEKKEREGVLFSVHSSFYLSMISIIANDQTPNFLMLKGIMLSINLLNTIGGGGGW